MTGLLETVGRLGPERMAALRPLLPPRFVDILDLDAGPDGPPPPAVLCHRWGVSRQIVWLTIQRFADALLAFERTGEWHGQRVRRDGHETPRRARPRRR